MKKYWRIVPINDGYSYLGRKNNNYIICSKSVNELDLTLIFATEEEASVYITRNLSPDKYKPEWVLLNEKYYNNLKLTKVVIYASDEICPCCGAYTADGDVCIPCQKQYNIYKPRTYYVEGV